MEFLKERVYTAVNADELKIGSKVIMASDLTTLKCYVRDEYGVTELQRVRNEDWIARFEADDLCYALCYLVSEPEEKKLKWTELRVGDVIREKSSLKQCMVTEIDISNNEGLHIFANHWFTREELEKWEKVTE